MPDRSPSRFSVPSLWGAVFRKRRSLIDALLDLAALLRRRPRGERASATPPRPRPHLESLEQRTDASDVLHAATLPFVAAPTAWLLNIPGLFAPSAVAPAPSAASHPSLDGSPLPAQAGVMPILAPTASPN